jgi:hypothetical protein
VSRTCIAPVERVKILFQISKASSSSRRGYLHYIPEIYKAHARPRRQSRESARKRGREEGREGGREGGGGGETEREY